MLRALALALLLAPLAGCAAPATVTPSDAAAPPEGDALPSPLVEVFEWNGSAVAGHGTVARNAQLRPASFFQFVVRENATRIVATLEWKGAHGDLDLLLGSPRACLLEEGLVGLRPDRIQCGGARALGTGGNEGWFENRNGTASAPDSPATIVLDADAIRAEQGGCEGCRWWAIVSAKAAVSYAFTYRIEVWYE